MRIFTRFFNTIYTKGLLFFSHCIIRFLSPIFSRFLGVDKILVTHYSLRPKDREDGLFFWIIWKMTLKVSLMKKKNENETFVKKLFFFTEYNELETKV